MRLLKFYIFFFLLLLTIPLVGVNKHPLKFATFVEAADPAADPTANWTAVKGLQASFVSTNIRFKKSNIPSSLQSVEWEGSCWRGERVSAQIALWTKASAEQVRFEFSDFKGTNGAKFPASVASARFERFVLTDEFGNECGSRNPKDYSVSLVADMLDTLHNFNIEAQSVRPVWISVNIPENAIPGLYQSSLKLFVGNKVSKTFKLKVEVLPQTLPAPANWKFHLDLWQNPYAVARYHNVEKWSEKHWSYLAPLMKMLADAGQKVITTTLNNSPWGGQTYDDYDAMIGWTKKIDGSWQYDYSIFDKWVNFMMKLGINKQINCYSTVAWGNHYYYFDESLNKEVKITAIPSSTEYAAFWTPFLLDFNKHVTEKGWKNIIRLAMDERTPDEMKAALELLKKVVPELGISLADSHKSYKIYAEQLKDISVLHGSTVDVEDLNYRKSKGMITTYYACCANPFPNTFTYSPPVEGVFTAWYATAAGFDGFLRWAYNSWVEKPLFDSRFHKWPAGDPFIVYPDARSSIRFETLREGIQDVEKIRILREQFEKENSKEAQIKLKQLTDLLATFNLTSQPDDLEKRILIGKKLIADLSK